MPEKLVGAVDEVHVHRTIVLFKSGAGVNSGASLRPRSSRYRKSPSKQNRTNPRRPRRHAVGCCRRNRCGTAARVDDAKPEELRQFQARIDEYMVLHSRLEREAPPVKSADDPKRFARRKKGSPQGFARSGGTLQGAIFTPKTRTIFAAGFVAAGGADGAELERAINDDAPSPIPLASARNTLRDGRSRQCRRRSRSVAATARGLTTAWSGTP